ncbi:MAG: SRPBCC domain-containing protein [Proteobacteria bacterium]|nr:SRPBCC domain-containing protein [Pseudomonadota bacterium]MBU0966796.1 SRPBCC domain-containing protein [Pseudomonadota bacterium]
MREVRAEIDITAPAPSVWRVLTNFALYPEWNPFIRSVSGECINGGELSVTTASLFGILLNFQLKVDNILENRGMRWLGQTIRPGLLDGHHYFEIHELSPNKVRFVQYEEFSGFMLTPSWPVISPLSRRGFDSMNKALKERVEQDLAKAS